MRWTAFKKNIVLVVIFIIAHPVSVFAFDDHCDPRLQTPENDPSAYRIRDGRCEGVYVKQVSTSSLVSIASFTRAFDNYSFSTHSPLVIEWQLPSMDNSVRLRARGLKRKLYYQMDSHRPSGEHKFIWPIDLLQQKDISKSSLGIVGWTELSIAGKKEEVLLPLLVRQKLDNIEDKNYKITIVPEVKLSEVFMSLAKVDDNGGVSRFLLDEKPLNYGYYPAGRGIDVTLPAIEQSGIYLLELATVIASGGSSTRKYWFFHPDE